MNKTIIAIGLSLVVNIASAQIIQTNICDNFTGFCYSGTILLPDDDPNSADKIKERISQEDYNALSIKNRINEERGKELLEQ